MLLGPFDRDFTVFRWGITSTGYVSILIYTIGIPIAEYQP